MKVLVMTMVSMTIIIMTNILMTMMILTMMMVKIFCRPASYGSWQAQTASKVEGPSKEPGPFLYSGMILFDFDDGDYVEGVC